VGDVLAAVVAVSSIAGDAAAELLSSRPITVVIPFTPGASADTLQRIVNKKVTENTGQILVVESRGGGGGAIGASVVKQAPPDGHTLFQANAGTHAANQSLYATLPYDPIKDFRPITLLWSFPQLLAVASDSPAKTVDELVALAKSKPGGLSFASQGTGSGGHLLGEMLKASAKVAEVRKFLSRIYNQGGKPEDLSVLTDDDVITLAGNLREGVPFATPVFDGASEDEIKEMLEAAGLPRGGSRRPGRAGSARSRGHGRRPSPAADWPRRT